ncbi:prepilin-type N-terminal cleavage/methylation domain-containing protein [Chryseomicrobium imtechense]
MNEKTYLDQKNEMMGENSFMKKLLKKRLNQKGLTLIELLAVIVILAIVAAIAIPAIGNVISNSRVGAIKGDAQTALSAANIYFTDNGSANGSVVSLDQLLAADLLDGPASLTPGTPGTDAGAVSITKNANGNFISGVGAAGGVTLTFNQATGTNITNFPNNTANGTAQNITIAR